MRLNGFEASIQESTADVYRDLKKFYPYEGNIEDNITFLVDTNLLFEEVKFNDPNWQAPHITLLQVFAIEDFELFEKILTRLPENLRLLVEMQCAIV